VAAADTPSGRAFDSQSQIAHVENDSGADQMSDNEIRHGGPSLSPAVSAAMSERVSRHGRKDGKYRQIRVEWESETVSRAGQGAGGIIPRSLEWPIREA
jgi:hypothetical protein